MCFGNDSPPPAFHVPAPPPATQMMDFFDEVTGTQFVITTNAKGEKQGVKKRMPRTPEEEIKLRAAEEVISSSLNNMIQLYRYDPASMVDFAPLVETFANISRQQMQALGEIANIGNIEQDIAEFKNMKRTLIDEEFAIKNRQNEETLAHKGRGFGTYAAESRAALARNEALARQQGDIQASIYGEELASKRLARNKETFNLQEMGRQGQLQSVAGQYALAKEHEADIERRRLRAIEENKALMGVGMAITGADLNKALASTNVNDSLAIFNAQANDSMNRYNADVNRQMANYNMAMNEYKNRPPSFAERALNIGGTIGSAILTGHPESLAGRIGTKFVG